MHRFGLAFLLIGIASTASAGLTGTTVQTCWNSSYSGAVTIDTSQCNSTTGFSTTSAIVTDPGVEFSAAGKRLADFNDTGITIQYVSFSGSATPDLFIFWGLPGTVTDMVLLTSNPLNITTAFGGDSIAVRIGSPVCCTSSTVSVSYRIDFAGSGPGAVPEPATMVLTSLGLAAAGVEAKRRIRRRAA